MKVIAWYLPQFHETKENNEWWGKGFTDWVNVKKGIKFHSDQYQPRIPLNNNYYDLLNDNVKKWQVDLAKKYGVYGFCMHHYWFGGKLLLEKPMEQFLDNKKLDIPFCINWANEHWTTSWSGGTKVLIKQEYGVEKDWIEHFNYLLPFFKDDRYIKEDGKPLFIIFIPQLIDCLEEMICCWQRLAKENGLPGLKIAYANKGQNHSEMSKEKKKFFDYCIDYQPAVVFSDLEKNGKRGMYGLVRTLWRATGKKILNNLHITPPNVPDKLRADDYDEIWKTILNRKPEDEANIPGAIVNWDNTARKGKRGSYFKNFSVEKFYQYMKKMITKARTEYKQDKIFIFSWNEWAEGGYLEPDEKYGCAVLEALYQALNDTNELPEYPDKVKK